MKINLDRRKITGILFVLTILLLSLNLIISKYSNPYHQKKSGEELTLDQVKTKLFESLHSVGLEDDWIKLKKNYNKKESLPTYYSIDVPKDLPIPLVVKEISNEFKDYNITVEPIEQRFNGSTEIKFYSNDDPVLRIEMNYVDNIWRDAGYIGLMILLPNSINQTELNSLLNIPEYFTFILVPSKNARQFKNEIKDHEKNYAILLNDDIQPMEFSLKSSYSAYRIRNAISAIVGNFSDADFFMIDNNSDIFSSKNYELIKEGFKKRKINLFEENSFVNLSDESESRMRTDFENTVTKTGKGKTTEIILSVGDLESLMDDIAKFRKVGYKFVYSSSLVTQ